MRAAPGGTDSLLGSDSQDSSLGRELQVRQSAAGQEFTTRVRPEVLEAGSDISATLALSEDIVLSQYLSAWKQKQLFPCLKMQPVLQNAKSVFGNIPVKVTSVAK